MARKLRFQSEAIQWIDSMVRSGFDGVVAHQVDLPQADRNNYRCELFAFAETNADEKSRCITSAT